MFLLLRSCLPIKAPKAIFLAFKAYNYRLLIKPLCTKQQTVIANLLPKDTSTNRQSLDHSEPVAATSENKILLYTGLIIENISKLILPTNSPSVSGQYSFITPLGLQLKLKAVFDSSCTSNPNNFANNNLFTANCQHFYNVSLVFILLHLNPDSRKVFLKRYPDFISILTSTEVTSNDFGRKPKSYEIICQVLDSDLKEMVLNGVSCGLFTISDNNTSKEIPLSMFTSSILYWILFGLVKFGDFSVHKYSTRRLANLSDLDFTNAKPSSPLSTIPFLWDFLERKQKLTPPNDLLVRFFSFLVDYPEKSAYLKYKLPTLSIMVQSDDISSFFFSPKKKINLLFSVMALEQLALFNLWEKVPDFVEWFKKYYNFPLEVLTQSTNEIEQKLYNCLCLSYPIQIPSLISFRVSLFIARKEIFALYLAFMSPSSIQEALSFLLRDRLDLVLTKQIYDAARRWDVPDWNKVDRACWLEWFIISTISSLFRSDVIIRESPFLASLHGFLVYLVTQKDMLNRENFANSNDYQSQNVLKLPLLPRYLSSIKPWITLAFRKFLGPITISDIIDAIPKALLTQSCDFSNLNSTIILQYSQDCLMPKREILFSMLLLTSILELPSFDHVENYLHQIYPTLSSTCLNEDQPTNKMTYFLFPKLSTCFDSTLNVAIKETEMTRCKLFNTNRTEQASLIPFNFLSYDYFCAAILNHLTTRAEWMIVIGIIRHILNFYSKADFNSFLAIDGIKFSILTAAIATNSFDLIPKLVAPQADFSTDNLFFPNSNIYISLLKNIDPTLFISDDIIIQDINIQERLALARPDLVILKKIIKDSNSPTLLRMANIRSKLLKEVALSANFRKRIDLPNFWIKFRRDYLKKHTNPKALKKKRFPNVFNKILFN